MDVPVEGSEVIRFGDVIGGEIVRVHKIFGIVLSEELNLGLVGERKERILTDGR